MKVNPTEAAQISGVTRKTLYADMQKGTLSYELTDKKKRLIHVAELERVYGQLKNDKQKVQQDTLFETPLNTSKPQGNADMSVLKARLEFLELERQREREQFNDQIEHLRTMLSSEQEERRKITALLTDQSSEREQNVQKQSKTEDEITALRKTVLELKRQNKSIFKAFKEEKQKGFWQKLIGA